MEHLNIQQKYTCLMHPEIVQEKPGNCPECGMALVLVKNNKETKSLQQHVSNTPIGYKGHNHI